MEKLEIKTSRGILNATTYDDVCAQGIRIMLDDEIIALIDVYSEKNGEIRVLAYDNREFECDEPSHCIHIEI